MSLGQNRLLSYFNILILNGVDEREVLGRTGPCLLCAADSGRKTDCPLKASIGGNVLVAPGIGDDYSNAVAEPFGRIFDGSTLVDALTGFAPFLEGYFAVDSIWQFRINDEILAVALVKTTIYCLEIQKVN